MPSNNNLVHLSTYFIFQMLIFISYLYAFLQVYSYYQVRFLVAAWVVCRQTHYGSLGVRFRKDNTQANCLPYWIPVCVVPISSMVYAQCIMPITYYVEH